MALSDPHKIKLVLQEVCADRVPVALMSRDLLVMHHGSFVTLGDESIVLEFGERPSGLSFSPPAFCIASFNYQTRPHLFTTRVKLNRGEPDDSPAQVEIEVPAAMRWPESRKAVRLVVPDDAPLVIAVRVDSRELDAKAIDISLCGALIEVHAHRALELGERVVFTAQSGGVRVELPAIVRRADGVRYGLYFPDAVIEGRLDPPATWRRLVEALARSG